jgi:gamma-glutamyltranspeptidase/glutathione hydrolase
MVATSQPLAAQAGLAILQAGGNAADAAIATAAMLNVVEPLSTGIGGDCFALYFDAATQQVTALNGSGRAPAAASANRSFRLATRRMPTFTGHAVSIPGTVAGWSDLLARHGRMTLADVLQPAIWTAEHGYPVSELIALGWRTQEQEAAPRPRLAERRPRPRPAPAQRPRAADRRARAARRRDDAHPHAGRNPARDRRRGQRLSSTAATSPAS